MTDIGSEFNVSFLTKPQDQCSLIKVGIWSIPKKGQFLVSKIFPFKPILWRKKTGWPLSLPGAEADKKVPVILALGRLRRDCQKFKASLD